MQIEIFGRPVGSIGVHGWIVIPADGYPCPVSDYENFCEKLSSEYELLWGHGLTMLNYPDGSVRLHSVREMYNAYVECALWSSLDDTGDSLDSRYSESEIDRSTKKEMADDCIRFAIHADDKIADDYGQAGSDFWLTRNGHGAGFWDGGWDERGPFLTKLSKSFSEYNLFTDGEFVYGCEG